MLNEEIVVSIDPTGRKVQRYAKKQFLGHGGFARCYTMINLRTGEKFAGKVIKKKQLKDKQSRQKIFQQIQIHKQLFLIKRSLNHQNICQFYDMFQFQQEIYIILQLCQNNSLKEFLKSRVRITQFEAKYYLLQIINGMQYLHRLSILHRDIKLGNIFLNYKMQVKIGDFGLSTKLKSHRDRRFTTCGTPNYIAPEILNETGHGFEVDIWAVGIMLYALVVGKPPFQADTVDNTYKRIKENTFSFPKQIPLTIQCKSIIKNLLQPNPKYRITLEQLRNHDFLTKTRIPLSLPPYTISIPPQNSFLKQHGCNEKPMKLTIFPRKISNTYDIDESLSSKQSNLNNSKYNKQKNLKKMSRVLSLDKQLFKTTRIQQPANDQKSTLNRCHIYNSRNRITSMLNSSRKKGLYGSVQNIHLSNDNRLSAYRLKQKIKQNDICEITCYFDMQQKYGMGYLLSNGNYGVIFNDKTSLTKLETLKDHQTHYSQSKFTQQQQRYQYIYYHKEQNKLVNLPQSLKKKQSILEIVYSKLKKYKQENIPVPFQSSTFVKKIANTEQFFMLKLSNDILQFFWLTDTVILRGHKWIKWRIGKYDGQSVISNPSLPYDVKIKLDQIRIFLAKNASKNSK